MTLPRFDVVGVGENSVDVVYRVPGAIAPDSKLRVTSRRVSAGGQVATTLVTCARLGLRTAYVGTFGSDDHGRLAREALQTHGVDTSHAAIVDVPNRHAVIVVDERSGERCVLWQRDGALALQADALPADLLASARVVHVDAVDEAAALAAARIASAAGAHVTTDVDEVTPGTTALIEAATFPVLAARVPEALTGEHDPERALRALRQRHGGMLCVTLGAAGAMLLAGEELHHAPAPRVDAVDTTGAGDVFRGALIYALLRGDSPDAMLRFATAAAASSCTRPGAIGSVPSLADITRLATEGIE